MFTNLFILINYSTVSNRPCSRQIVTVRTLKSVEKHVDPLEMISPLIISSKQTIHVSFPLVSPFTTPGNQGKQLHIPSSSEHVWPQ